VSELTEEQMIAADPENSEEPDQSSAPPRFEDFEVGFTDDKTPKLILPDKPAVHDLAGAKGWLTVVLNLDRSHPVIGAAHQGLRGPEGHVVLRRPEVPDLRFEPAALLSSSRRLLPALIAQLLPSDGEPYGFKDEHCRRIAFVVQRLCGAEQSATEAQETAAIVGDFLLDAQAIEGHRTYGDRAAKYEAAAALQTEIDERGRPLGRNRYLIDADTGELVIRVRDLRVTARAMTGTVPHGWLDARMDDLGWKRVVLDAHAESGRTGRRGPHLRPEVYRGHLPAGPER
jgi:hypothetical protein